MATKTGQPRIQELKGRPLGRVLVKMSKVTREQVAEILRGAGLPSRETGSAASA